MNALPQRPPPLLLVCALEVERRALRGGDLSAAPAALGLLRTGMGPRAAARTMARVLRGEPAHPAARQALLVTGFCAGLRPGTAPGDVVVATGLHTIASTRGRQSAAVHPTARAAAPHTESPHVPVPQRTTDCLARALRGLGLAVHTGPLASGDRLVRGADRALLHRAGPVAADMESAAVVRTALAAGPRPFAVVRVIVDTPDHELLRWHTIRTATTAYRALRTAIPAFLAWHRTLTSTGPATTSSTHTPLHDPLPGR